MTWAALVAFYGYPGGVETHYQPGDVIPDEAAVEMDLASKPELAEETE